MFKGLRIRWGTRRLQRALRRREVGRSSYRLGALEEEGSFLFIAPFDSEEAYFRCLSLQEELQGAGKRVAVVAYRDGRKGQPYLEQGTDRHVLSPERVNFFFRPDELSLIPIRGRGYDYIIDFNQRGCLPLQWVVHLVDASVKVGLDGGALALYDMQVSLPEGFSVGLISGEGAGRGVGVVGVVWAALSGWLSGCSAGVEGAA